MARLPLEVRRLPGLTPYPAAHGLQVELLRRRQEDRGPDTLLLLEHEAVITLGRNADPAGVLAAPASLEAAGIGVRRVERGGQATYHGPGQAVGYPILRLRDHGLGVRAFVERLEEVLIQTAARFGVSARTIPGRPGVYARGGKLGAIGVAVARGVTWHGFAFNVRPDLSHFGLIVPCGQADIPPTSLEALTASAPPMDEVFRALADAFAGAFGIAPWAPRAAPPGPTAPGGP